MHTSHFRLALAASLTVGSLLTPAFAASPTAPLAPSTASASVTVPEVFISDESPGDELDSLATWRNPDGGTWLIATAKSSHKLIVFDADTGKRLREVGGKGKEPGQFRRPNGISVLNNRVYVAERDNHRVQVLSLPDFNPIGIFGEGDLRSPYGLWLNPDGKGALEVYITDNFMLGERFDVVPPLDQLDKRVHRFHLHFDDRGKLSASPAGTFGDTSEKSALRIVESIAGDARHNRLLIADEYQPKSTLHEYTLEGKATGRRVPDDVFSFEAEGVALWSCSSDKGYWIAVDQLSPLTAFHFFDRNTLNRVGTITGNTVSTTDGIVLRTSKGKKFPAGALYAVHADKSVGAFDLRDIVKMLKLDKRCL